MKRKQKKVQKKSTKEYTPFPPEQRLRKEDYQMMTGEFFLSEKAKANQEKEKRRDEKEKKKQEKLEAKNKEFVAPVDEAPVVVEKSEKKEKHSGSKPDLEELKKKFLKKK